MTREEREAQRLRLEMADVLLANSPEVDHDTRAGFEPVIFRWDASSHEVLVIARAHLCPEDRRYLDERIVERLSRERFDQIRKRCLA